MIPTLSSLLGSPPLGVRVWERKRAEFLAGSLEVCKKSLLLNSMATGLSPWAELEVGSITGAVSSGNCEDCGTTTAGAPPQAASQVSLSLSTN